MGAFVGVDVKVGCGVAVFVGSGVEVGRDVPVGSGVAAGAQAVNTNAISRTKLIEYFIVSPAWSNLFCQGYLYKERAARQFFFVVAFAFHPDLASMRLDNASRDREPQPGSAAFEFCPPGRMQFHFAHLI